MPWEEHCVEERKKFLKYFPAKTVLDSLKTKQPFFNRQKIFSAIGNL
jgi:hypothetical protein